MWTLALRGGACVAVVAAVAVEWCDVFGVVTRGRVQLELRDGKPGRPTARVRIVTPRVTTATCQSPSASCRMMEERHEQHE